MPRYPPSTRRVGEGGKLIEALQTLTGTSAVLYLIFGALLRLVVGILPALGDAAGLPVLIPFIYGMDPSAAMAMVIGMLATVSTGDTITSVLLGVPGSASYQATVLDGFPMAKLGQAARALSAGFLSYVIGGLFGALVLTLTLQSAKQVILWFGIPEILIMVLFGVASVAALSGRSLAKGGAICAFGMVMASVGFAPASGEQRLDLGLFYLGDGLPLIACVIGVFVIPEIVDLIQQNRSISDRPSMGNGTRQGVMDVLRHKWIVLRSATVGCLVGAMRRFGFSRPAFLIGFVLQQNLEKSLYQTAQLYSLTEFLSRPIVLILLVVVLVILGTSIKQQMTKTPDNTYEIASLRQTRPVQVILPAALALFFAAALWMVRDLQPRGRMFPMVAGGFGLLACAVTLLQQGRSAPSALEDSHVTGPRYSVSFVHTAAWLVAAVLSIACFGFFAGAALFKAAFLLVEARAKLLVEARAKLLAALAGVIIIIGIYLFLTYQSGTFLPDGWVLSLNPWDYF